MFSGTKSTKNRFRLWRLDHCSRLSLSLHLHYRFSLRLDLLHSAHSPHLWFSSLQTYSLLRGPDNDNICYLYALVLSKSTSWFWLSAVLFPLWRSSLAPHGSWQPAQTPPSESSSPLCMWSGLAIVRSALSAEMGFFSLFLREESRRACAAPVTSKSDEKSGSRCFKELPRIRT